ncbi:hypothetical protein GCM10009430_09100 [Aquimarina litoralis]|uniref:Uncharacterized protein n=1 Tax=Aquimarina litoralis TaxID=584605 RepID=A0ABP3TPV6_9FLAO
MKKINLILILLGIFTMNIYANNNPKIDTESLKFDTVETKKDINILNDDVFTVTCSATVSYEGVVVRTFTRTASAGTLREARTMACGRAQSAANNYIAGQGGTPPTPGGGHNE